MSITMSELEELLKESGIKNFDRQDQRGCFVFGITTEHYQRMDGTKSLLLVAELSENGEYFKLFAPMAYKAEGEHLDAFLRTCMVIQWVTKLIQFEYDSTDGEIRPIIEFPLEDGTLTEKQLRRCLGGMVALMEDYSDELTAALTEGKTMGTQDAFLSALEEMVERMKRERAQPPETL